MQSGLKRVVHFSSRIPWYSCTQIKIQRTSYAFNLLKCQAYVRNTHTIPRILRNEIIQNKQIVISRTFHTTSVQKAAPLLGPILVKLMAPIYRLLFLLIGRRYRKWWSALPPEQRAIYLSRLYKNRNHLYVVFGVAAGLSASYYVYHIEKTPITGRRRFIILNEEQLSKVIDAQTRLLTEKLSSMQVATSDYNHTRVYTILNRLFQANHLDNTDLLTNIHVIVSDEVNAFVVADGNIFVFTGMLNAVANDDELAGILGHELSHALLNHSAEQLSRSGFFNIFSIVVFTLLWAVAPTDLLSILGSWLQDKIEDILIILPYSRKLEREADEVGMMLAATACYDVTQIPKFWERMNVDEMKNVEINDWLSTHPSHDKRVGWLNDNMPKALDKRDEMKCPRLDSFFQVVKRSIFDLF